MKKKIKINRRVKTGDNSTNKPIAPMMGDVAIKGGKGSTTDAGNHEAIFAYQPGTVPAGEVCADLMEMHCVTNPEYEPIHKEVQATMDRMPAEGQKLLRFD